MAQSRLKQGSTPVSAPSRVRAASKTRKAIKQSNAPSAQSEAAGFNPQSAADPQSTDDPLAAFHPIVQAWFRGRFKAPTDAQTAGWPAIQANRDVLIAAPTGSGKTLAAFLAGIDSLLKQAEASSTGQKGALAEEGGGEGAPSFKDETQIVYISPLKALGNDIQRNLEAPLAEIADLAATSGYDLPPIRTFVRSGDTPQKDRQAFVKRPPHILITTPESLYLMLTAQRSRETLRHVRTVIVDEIHALARDKRGSHLALSLARLDHICEARPARIGLSATQKPVEEIAAFLVGSDPEPDNGAPGHPSKGSHEPRAHPERFQSVEGSHEPEAQRSVPESVALAHPSEGSREPQASPERFQSIGSHVPKAHPERVQIVDLGHQRDLELHIEVPPSDLEAVAAREQWTDIYDRLAGLIRAHRTTLVFVNTRRLSERVAHSLREQLGEEAVASHHGSLSRDRRLGVEQRLKSGDLKALVCTASLELGIDIGSIDLVCQIGLPRSVATFLQRVGRSGHALGLRPQGRLFPTSRDELVECAALIRAVRAGRLDRIVQPVAPLDILAQQIVADCAAEDWSVDDLYALVRRAYPFRDLARDDFDEVLEMLGEGIGEGAGRAPPLLHHDRINRMLRGRRGARMTAILNGGAIPEMADYRVVAEPDDTVVGTVNEDWAIESMAGDIFLLGSHSWRIKRVGGGEVRVEDARGAPPNIPFWLGEAPGRTRELSQEVGRLRRDVVAGLDAVDALRERIKDEAGLDDLGAVQIIDYLRASRDALGLIPSDTDVVFERFFDETGGMQLVLHAPFGARINRAWGLALRKRFCVRFDFELQAAASDDSIVLSLGPQHSFPLEESFRYVTAATAEASLRQAVLYVPIFPVRWRWNAGRALAVPRFQGARKVPPPIQRMHADDLLAAVFPAQVGCQENVTGPLQIPDHPLIRQTVDDCLHEAMDLDGLVEVLGRIEAGEVRLHAIDTLEPSPMAHEVLSGKPFTYLDDAPLEERRTRAVSLRRSLPESARELGALDPEAIARVREEAWPAPRDVEETHDALLSLVVLPAAEARPWQAWLDELVESGRAARFGCEPDGGPRFEAFLAVENLRLIELLYPEAEVTVRVRPPAEALVTVEDRDDARLRLVRGWTEASGPVAVAGLGARLGLGAKDIDYGLRQLEAAGHVLRGMFTPRQQGDGSPDSRPGPEPAEGTQPERPQEDQDEYCDRRLLARIHRYTLDRLRREIDPVSGQDFMRFLLRWQHLTADTRLAGKAGLRQAIARLQGFEAPAAAWERELLAARVGEYHASWLDELCLAGEVAWARLTPRRGGKAGAAPTRATPVSVVLRRDYQALLAAVRRGEEGAAPPRAGAATEIHDILQQRGALFFDEIVNASRRLASDVERGLRELVARGLVSADGFQGLRQLTGRGSGSGRRRQESSSYDARGFFAGSGPAGRWSLVADGSAATGAEQDDALAETVAGVLLQRYGVLFRDLYGRESSALPWRDVLRALRRLEARGLVRGGRFVSGLSGEQYALPEAVDALRWERRQARAGDRVYVAATDPVNLVGVVVPGERLPAVAGRRILFVDGLPQPAEDAGAMKAPVPSKLTPDRATVAGSRSA